MAYNPTLRRSVAVGKSSAQNLLRHLSNTGLARSVEFINDAKTRESNSLERKLPLNTQSVQELWPQGQMPSLISFL
jgi:hypothetical protein